MNNKINWFMLNILLALVIASTIIILSNISNYIKEQPPRPKVLAIKQLKSKQITNSILTNRKDKYLLIEKCIGTCLDNKGNGEYKVNNQTYYISYKGVNGVKRGDNITSYFVYDNDNYTDSISIRFDVINK